ncbi:BT_3928 family protein [Chryseobacterium koreense]|uniref:BT_3928 family protein n=1 Tax=Chryseobacterium koreense TaxID=232216 RepID=UPI0026F34A06|nr:BT_3928 family protein [Chryseobacterium koreense]
MKHILRVIIAVIFIASGFVKAIDAVGFSFKLEEYFSPSVFNMPFFEKQALPIAIFVVAIELIFGFMLLLKIRLKFTLSILIALSVFFGFLTFYSAYFQVVTDCGCFGDALKFTPWQSFWKDIALLLGLLLLWQLYRKDFNHENNGRAKTIALISFVIAMGMVTAHGIKHEPLIDFRDYKIGTNLISEKEKIQKNPSEYKTFYSLKNEKTGEVIDVNQDDYVNKEEYWKEGSPWKIQEGKTTSKIVKEGYASEIMKFKPENLEGMDLTDAVLMAPKALILFSYDPLNADKNILEKTEKLLQEKKDTYVLGVSNNPNTFTQIPKAMMDATAIKTIARSNPFVLVLERGKILDKMSAEDYLKN